MCGIVGLFLKDETLHSCLGNMLTQMLSTMGDRGPDSSGMAIYNSSTEDICKLTIMSDKSEDDFGIIQNELEHLLDDEITISKKHNHAVLNIPKNSFSIVIERINQVCPAVRIMSTGERIEIYKEIGLPEQVTALFKIQEMTGTHGIGHTRMATESEVTTFGAHPFSTGMDQCLVHNGSLSNHNLLRRKLAREGFFVKTENDTEVAAIYLTWKMEQGYTLEEALKQSLFDLDGFFTFLVGTKNGFGVLRDPIACKPAVMAETNQYVAFGSEYRALATLPNINSAKVWEPEPATVYFWEL